jgi:hypothetical protein
MTKEAVEKRLAELKEKQSRLLADLQAHEGAIQDCYFWLQVLAQKDSLNG